MNDNVQKAHYEAMHDEYEQHYYDKTSLDYRRQFLFKPALKGLNLAGKRVADIACGSGWNTILVREMFPTASFEGFDISSRACESYVRNTGFPANESDFSTYRHEGEKFDFAIVVGGIHHMVSDLGGTAAAIGSLLKRGGYLIAYEPNANFFLNRVRNAWYRADRYFEDETERAISLEELRQIFSGELDLVDTTAIGGPSYIAILNSMILRIPLTIKRPLAGILNVGEHVYNVLPGSAPFPAFISRWSKV
ncbi:class I SAM-dependent methyltransferase [Rhizobium sp. BK376]|uniref:class I SAM-dependent methyltransferase n=1 Tax=Rhizobium sp. BK376 TaxID=2512149 RepID=UPI00104C0023|nr:class I SAM-dependent methyltransferase [Rhizobium sp. BK376]TCR61661.1 methyltransferase family protein [Rhizobium sp. BK376]